jgi:HSP20 family molecular chaperone IbpA
VDPGKIEANYVNGVLATELPKQAEAKPKQIKLNVAKSLKAA